MTRASARLSPLIVPLLLLTAPAPIAPQTSLTALTTQDLYAEARARAAKVSDRCYMARKSDYLEALSYLFAYYQVASRDGSLQSAPDFDRAIKQQFAVVLRTSRKCLDLMDENSSAGMRSDGTEARIAAPPPVERVDLPQPPPPGAGPVVTDAQGRTIQQLLDEITQLKQQREVFAAEVGRLRSLQTPPPPPPPPPAVNLSGEYRIQVKANNLFWHEDGNGDQKISTRYQPGDDFTRFILEQQSDGSYRIRVKASGRYLHAPGHEDWLLSTLSQVDDDYTRFFIQPEPDGAFRLVQKATGRYIGLRGDGLLTNNAQADDDFIRFRLYR